MGKEGVGDSWMKVLTREKVSRSKWTDTTRGVSSFLRRGRKVGASLKE